MSIFKDTFRDYVKFQLGLRDEIVSIGNPGTDSPVSTGFTAGGEDVDLSDDPASLDRRIYGGYNASKIKIKIGDSTREANIPNGAFFSLLNRQAVIRMTSLVDYVSDVDLEIGDLQAELAGAGVGFERLKGAALSQNFILEGGVLSNFARNLDRDKDGIPEPVLRRVDQPRRAFPRPNQRTNLGYGDFAIGADANEDGYGIVPMPGITQANIRTKSAYGSLREARVEFVCHNRRQLEVLEMLYMRPGYVVLLEWGWSPFINNEGEFIDQFKYIENYTNGKIYTNAITQNDIYNAINGLKEDSAGNYDGLLGFIKNFGFEARPDGGYNCYTELISMGEVLDSLKIANSAVYKTELVNSNGSRSFKALPSINTTQLNSAEEGGDFLLTQQEYAYAYSNNLTLEVNGLLGLIQSLYNASNFNTSYLVPYGVTTANTFEQDRYQEIFALYEKQLGFNPNNGIPEDSSFDYIRRTQNTISYNNRDNSDDLNTKSLFVDLVRFQSDSILADLHRKLDILPEQLQSFLIKKEFLRPIDGSLKLTTTNTAETYIRWDALCVLINDMLIPKDEKEYNTFNIIADRVYDIGNKKSKIDPLLYCPITAFRENGEYNPISDFSCDPNVCILPNQFELEGSGIEQTLGYKPDLSIFPLKYLIGIYGRTDKEYYYNDSVVDINGTTIQLSDDDKIRRIGGIFLNLKMLLNIAEKNQNEDEYTLGKFLTEVWGEVNKVCPNHNFVLTDDKESNSIFVIDLPVDNSKTPSYKDLYEFIPFSNKNTLREFSYESLVPSALSATIAIQAQDPRSITDIDGVTFAAFNRSIKNRLFSEDITPNWEKIRNDLNNRRTEIANQILRSEDILRTYAINVFRNLQLEANNGDIIGGTDNVIGVLKSYQTSNAYLQSTFNTTSTFTSVIPLNFNLKMDGISGIVIGNIFKIRKDRLPKAYSKTNVGFIVFNESQTITAGQDWTTDLSGKMIILPDSNYNIQGNIVYKNSREQFTDQEKGSREQLSDSRLDETQIRVGDVGQLKVGDPVYLKKIKINSIINFEGNVGFSFVRSTPEVDNEDPRGGDLFQIDNAIGAFNSWQRGGLELGVVKEIKEQYYEDNTAVLYPEYYSLYGIDNTRFTNLTAPYLFVITGTYIDENGLEYVENNEARFLKTHTTTVKAVWYSIVFNENASNLFLNGYVLSRTNLGIIVDTNGADDALPNSTNLYNYSQGTNNAWMRDDVLAASQLGAVDLNSNGIIDINEYSE
jgi:hypothetical protein